MDTCILKSHRDAVVLFLRCRFEDKMAVHMWVLIIVCLQRLLMCTKTLINLQVLCIAYPLIYTDTPNLYQVQECVYQVPKNV